MAFSLAQRAWLQSRQAASFPAARVAIALLALLLAVQVARLFWTIFTPVGSLGDWRAAPVNIVPPAVRAALFSGFDPFFRTDLAASGTANVTSLNLTLFGVRANEASGGGSAIIAGEDGIQNSYGVGEEVAPGVILETVAFDHVILSRGGVKESLYLDQSVPAQTVGATPAPAVAPSGAPEGNTGGGMAALNPETIQRAIGFAPRNEGGRVTGIVLQPRDDGTMLRIAGFQPGDVITGVNGRPVSSAADIASQLRPGARLSIEIERGGQTLPIALNLEQP
jgi:general secretion pathway protein C